MCSMTSNSPTALIAPSGSRSCSSDPQNTALQPGPRDRARAVGERLHRDDVVAGVGEALRHRAGPGADVPDRPRVGRPAERVGDLVRAVVEPVAAPAVETECLEPAVGIVDLHLLAGEVNAVDERADVGRVPSERVEALQLG